MLSLVLAVFGSYVTQFDSVGGCPNVYLLRGWNETRDVEALIAQKLKLRKLKVARKLKITKILRREALNAQANPGKGDSKAWELKLQKLKKQRFKISDKH